MTRTTKTRLLAAIVQGLVVMLTALAIYDRPPDWGSYYQPVLQGLLAVLASLGVGAGVRRL